MRLFIAIELPEPVKQQLEALRSDISGARWVPPAQLHLTLAFLGDVSVETQAMLENGLADIDLPPFFFHFVKTGCFPDRRRPRVLWAGIAPEPRLEALACRVRETILSCGIPQEERPFSPHITLARLKHPACTDVSQFLDNHMRIGLQPVEVMEFALFSSSLGATGAQHAVLKRFTLKSSGRQAEDLL